MRKLESRGGKNPISLDDDNLINLTPLIDVVFVVLIMFILVAPILEIDRVDLVSQQQKEKASPPPY